MPFHFCQDELLGILAIVPGVGFLVAWVKAKVHHWRKHEDCHR